MRHSIHQPMPTLVMAIHGLIDMDTTSEPAFKELFTGIIAWPQEKRLKELFKCFLYQLEKEK